MKSGPERSSSWRQRALLLSAMFLLFWFINAFTFAVGAEPFQNFRVFVSVFFSNVWGILQLSVVYAVFCLGAVLTLYVVGRITLVGSGTGDALTRNWSRLVACSLLIGCLLTASQLVLLPMTAGPLMVPPEGWLTSRRAALACYVVAVGVPAMMVCLAIRVAVRDKVLLLGVCAVCGYEVDGLAKCPECGTERAQRSD
jgi:hypothetical protein